MKKATTVLALATAVLLSHAIPPPARSDLSFVGAWPYGPPRAIALDDARGLAFFGSGGVVITADVANPGLPVPVSDTIKSRGVVQDLFYEAVNQRLFVAAGKGGLEIWDVAVPTAPRQLSAVEVLYFGVETPVEAVEVSGDFAYVAAAFGFVHWIDVSDPTNPIDAGFNGQGGSPSSELMASGGGLYVAGGNFVRFVIEPDGSLSAERGDINPNVSPSTAVFVSGHYAYIVSNGDLLILDLSQIFLPVVGSLLMSNARDVVVSGGVAYVADATDGLRVIDVSNPSHPLEIGSDDSFGMLDVRVSGSYAYAPGSSRFRVIDVSLPTEPTGVGSLDTESLAYDVAVSGDFAYVADSNAGFYAVNVANPADPFETGSVEVPDIALDVSLSGNHAYVAARYSGLRIFDLSDPADPVEIAFHVTPDYARGVFATGNFSYVADLFGGLRVIDVSDPGNPTEVGSASLPDFSNHVHVQGNHAYVSNGSSGLRVVDVSEPTRPHEVGFLGTSDYTADVFVLGSHAYLADFGGGLRIADVSNPADPTDVGSYAPPGIIVSGVYVLGNVAYLTDANEGVVEIDISDPSDPVEVCSQGTPGDALKLTCSRGLVYVADGAAGVQVYQASSTLAVLHPFPSTVSLRVWATSNPSTSGTSLQYVVPRSQLPQIETTIRIYDVRGALIRNLIERPHSPGSYRVQWKGMDEVGQPVSSGTYFVRMLADSRSATAKLVLTR